MAEKGILQPAAPGLLSALQLKQKGLNPDSLGDVVVPVMDLTHWYNADLSLVAYADRDLIPIAATPIYSSVSFSPALIVPDNQIWWVRAFVAEVFLSDATATGDVQGLQPVIETRQLDPANNAQGQHRADMAGPFDLPTGGTGAFFSGSLRDVWAPAGSELKVNVMSNLVVDLVTPATYILSGHVVYDRFLL